jgi:tRNA A37 threonylcarbamoyladenosine modification protein TsaB
MMAELLEKTGTNWPDLQAIAVLTGPGSFTGTRIGITAANTLGWLYRLPLIPLADKDFEGSIALLHSTSLPQTTRTILPSE